MNNIKEYIDFLNEDGFWSKSFDERIDEIDELFIKAADYNGKAVTTKHFSVTELMKADSNLKKYLKTISKITELLDIILKKYGKDITQEKLDMVVKRYSIIPLGGTGYRHLSTEFNEIRNNSNSILTILLHLKNFYGLQLINIDERVLDNPLVFYKKGDFHYLVHKSYADRKEKESKEAHAGVDPLGEENWDDAN